MKLCLALLRLAEKDGLDAQSIRYHVGTARAELDKVLCNLIADPLEQPTTEGNHHARP